MGALFTFSSIVYTQNVNHNLSILELEAINKLSSERQSEMIEREMQEKEQIRLSLETADGHLKDSQNTITRLQQELAYTTQTHKEQVVYHESIIHQHDEETHISLETVQGRLSDCQKKIMLLGQELANTTKTHTMQKIEDYKSIIQHNGSGIVGQGASINGAPVAARASSSRVEDRGGCDATAGDDPHWSE